MIAFLARLVRRTPAAAAAAEYVGRHVAEAHWDSGSESDCFCPEGAQAHYWFELVHAEALEENRGR